MIEGLIVLTFLSVYGVACYLLEDNEYFNKLAERIF